MWKSCQALIAVLLTGCVGLPDQSKYTPEQLTAMSKDKSVNAQCTKLNTPWGPQVTVTVGVDQKALTQGNVSVDEQCKITFQSEAAASAARR